MLPFALANKMLFAVGATTLLGYHPAGMYPFSVKLGPLTASEATAFRSPKVTYSVFPSGESPRPVGVDEPGTFISCGGRSKMLPTILSSDVRTTDTVSLPAFATYR